MHGFNAKPDRTEITFTTFHDKTGNKIKASISLNKLDSIRTAGSND